VPELDERRVADGVDEVFANLHDVETVCADRQRP
jgi:hypothetical protein